MPSQTTSVLFDIDGTLVDSTYQHALSWSRAFASVDIDVPVWRLHRSIGMGGDRLVPAIGGPEVEADLGDTLRERESELFEPMRNEVRPLPGAKDLLASLRQKGFVVGLASSGSEEDAQFAIDLLGAANLVDQVISSSEVSTSKPSPDVVAVAREKLGADYAAMVGDAVYDVHAAAAAGLPCVAVRTGGFGIAELTGVGAVLVVDDLSELLDADWDKIVHASPGEALR